MLHQDRLARLKEKKPLGYDETVLRWAQAASGLYFSSKKVRREM